MGNAQVCMEREGMEERGLLGFDIFRNVEAAVDWVLTNVGSPLLDQPLNSSCGNHFFSNFDKNTWELIESPSFKYFLWDFL